MSPLRAGRARVLGVSAEQLTARVAALEELLEAGGAQLPADGAERGWQVTRKVRERLGLSGGHTVVALAGATGSGKSSLFNALVGADVATVGVRRPTTSTPTAAVWGDGPAGELLDWLGVGARHQVAAAEGDLVAGSLDGLVLLDLPDFDSRELAHREVAERALGLVDVFVWVTDPQKYADARLHDDYIRALAAHDPVTLVVLNQVDRLTDAARAECVADLTRLLRADGLDLAQVVATSTRTGFGLDALRQRLANAVAGRNAARTRLAADVESSARELRASLGPVRPEVSREDVDRLRSALATAAGVPLVVDAVAREHQHAAVARTGLPWTRWVRRLRPRPLGRLRLDGDRAEGLSGDEVERVVTRSSLPAPTPSARAAVDLASRRVGDRVAQALPTAWSDAVHDAASPGRGDLADAVDRAIVGVPLGSRRPLWWAVAGALQVLLALLAVAGLAWLVVLSVLGWLQLPEVETPRLGWVPVPLALLAGGLLAGMLLALLARWFAAVGARRRARAAGRRLTAAVGTVADEQVVAPVRAVLARRESAMAAAERALT